MSLGRWIGRYAYYGLHDTVGPVWVITSAPFGSLQWPRLDQYSTGSLSRTVIVPLGTYSLYPYPLLGICRQNTR